MATRGHASEQLTVLEEIEEAKARLKSRREPETPTLPPMDPPAPIARSTWRPIFRGRKIASCSS
jgi:hypothetical protein